MAVEELRFGAVAATVHLLDVGNTKYGDAVLCQVDGRTILIDGGHAGDWKDEAPFESLPTQLGAILGGERPYAIDLLIVSHAHDDHIGCLPRLVADGVIETDWAYLPAPDLAWPDVEEEVELSSSARAVVAALREEDLQGLDRAELETAIAEAAGLKDRYLQMVDHLAATAQVVFHGDDVQPLQEAFAQIDLKVLGPDRAHLVKALDAMTSRHQQAVTAVGSRVSLLADAEVDPVALYLEVTEGFGVLESIDREGPAVNAQSVVVLVGGTDERILLAGDMQFAKAEVADLRESVEALWGDVVAHGPYQFTKLCHHGSRNANPPGFVEALGCAAFGICTGRTSPHHPNAGGGRGASAGWCPLDEHRPQRTQHGGVGWGPGRPRPHRSPDRQRPRPGRCG